MLFLVFIGIYYDSQVHNLKSSMESTVVQLTVRASSQFEGILDEMSRISLGVAGSEDVYQAMSGTLGPAGKENYFNSNPDKRRDIQRVIVGLNGSHYNNKSFNVISRSFDYLTLNIYDDRAISKEELETIPWIDYVLRHNISKYISPVAPDSYGYSAGETFSFVRLIQNQFYTYGAVDVQYKRSFLDDIFNIQIQKFATQTIIAYETGDVFYSTRNAPVQYLDYITARCPVKSGQQIVTSISLGKDKYTVCSLYVKPYDMKVYLLLNTNDYLAQVNEATTAIAVFGILILLFLLFIVYIITRNLYKPLRQLRDSINNIDYKTLSIDLNVVDTDNEVTLLTNAFNDIFTSIKRTTGELMQSRTRELTANYKVLQAQINPHFMHNILAVVGLMGYQKDAPEIMNICALLTKMLNYTTSTSAAVVNVMQEAEHTEIYLKLMKYRYLDNLEYSVDMENGFDDIPIPKFVLQPVVENCFQHSLVDMEPPYRITIRGRKTSGGWFISVEDNGAGFTPESIRELNLQFRQVQKDIESGRFSSDLKIGGLALINTYARLFIQSGGEIKLQISNCEEGGSRVVFLCERRDTGVEGIFS